MPSLDYMVLCDHVRAENGLLHMLAVGIDKMTVSRVPVLQHVGIAARLVFDEGEVADGAEFGAEITVDGPEGDRVFGLTGVIFASAPEAGIAGIPVRAAIALNVDVLLQQVGVHTLTLWVDGRALKTIPFMVVEVDSGTPSPRRREG